MAHPSGLVQPSDRRMVSGRRERRFSETTRSWSHWPRWNTNSLLASGLPRRGPSSCAMEPSARRRRGRRRRCHRGRSTPAALAALDLGGDLVVRARLSGCGMVGALRPSLGHLRTPRRVVRERREVSVERRLAAEATDPFGQDLPGRQHSPRSPCPARWQPKARRGEPWASAATWPEAVRPRSVGAMCIHWCARRLESDTYVRAPEDLPKPPRNALRRDPRAPRDLRPTRRGQRRADRPCVADCCGAPQLPCCP